MTEPSSRRISKQSVSSNVAAHIREMIFSGELGFGSRIPQDAIAESLGVSRLPVRSALTTLESEGMVITEPHRGTYVADITPDDLLDHYTICGEIHGLAAKRAASVISDEQVAELEAINADMSNEQVDARAYELHWTFHQRINRIGGSRRLRSVLQQLSHQLPTSLFTSVLPNDLDAATVHRDIVAALKARDGSAASDLCRDHLIREGELVVKRLSAQGLWADGSTAGN
ncbi:MAG: GntR family transcriptional regulator [Mycobacterium sp.]|jgi:DNA-binding GntR family transcriptional regulator|nr:GntR family transcriptional regulator [Mycobacterium sp.]